MKSATVILAVLAAAHCCFANAVEQEFQITPRVGFGEIRLKPGTTSIDVANQDGTETNTLDIGVAVSYVTPIGVVLEVGAQGQSNFSLFGTLDELTFSEEYVAAGFQLEFGNGFRLTPKVGRTRWRLRSKEGILFNPGPEAQERIDGYEDFWDVSLTKTVLDWVSMGVRYRTPSRALSWSG